MGLKLGLWIINLCMHKLIWCLRDYASQSALMPINGSAVIRLGEPIIRNGDTPAKNYRFDSMYGKDPYLKEKMPASILCMPISKLGGFSFYN